MSNEEEWEIVSFFGFHGTAVGQNGMAVVFDKVGDRLDPLPGASAVPEVVVPKDEEPLAGKEVANNIPFTREVPSKAMAQKK